MTRVSVIVHGRVQGVAFRHYASCRARELGVTGWVRNLPNGSVEGLFEGDDESVAALVEWCHSGPPAANVDRLEISQGSYSGQFNGFEITY
jgi:acylphosphatase